MRSLLLYINKLYLLIGIVLFMILMAIWHLPYVPYNLLVIFTFLAFSAVIFKSIYLKEHQFTNKRLALTVFFYSLIFVVLYMALSLFYTGNTFIFSEVDARLYEELSYSIKDLTHEEALSHLSSYEEFGYDDWGAPLTMSLMLNILPYKEFVNFLYIILNTISTCMLFAIGKNIMDNRHSYIGALVYGISSYTIFYMGSFLKETMLMFLVITSIYFLYKYRTNKKFRFIILGLAVSLLIIFFRPVITITIWISYFTYYLFVEKRKSVRLIMGVFGVISFIIALSWINDSILKYRVGRENLYSDFSLFDKLVFVLGGLIGPFPRLILSGSELVDKPLYGSGLLFKMMLFLCFWKGFFYSIRKKIFDALPIFIFVLVECLELIVILDSLELRKSLPHVPFFILASFWYIHQVEKKKDVKSLRRTKYWIGASAVLVFIIVLGWNTLAR